MNDPDFYDYIIALADEAGQRGISLRFGGNMMCEKCKIVKWSVTCWNMKLCVQCWKTLFYRKYGK